MLTRYVTLWLWPLISWPWSSWYIKRRVIRVSTKFERNRVIRGWIIDDFAIFCTRCVALWPWSLDLELLRHFDCHLFKLCTKFERNRIIHGLVIDDLARFTPCNFWEWGISAQRFSMVRELNFTKPGEDIGAGRFQTLKVGSKLSDVENDSKFRSFWSPPLWK